MKRLLPLLLAGTLIFSGCAFSVPVATETDTGTSATTSDEREERATVQLENAEGSMVLSIDDNDQFKGMTAKIMGSSVIQDEGEVIDEVLTVTDWGTGSNGSRFFDGMYSVRGPGLKQSRFSISTIFPQRYDPLICRINYYDLIMAAEGFTFAKASFLYDKEIAVSGAEGTISFTFYPISQEMSNTYNFKIFTFSCTAETEADLTLSWDGTAFQLVSSSSVSNCILLLETNEQKLSASSDASGQYFNITIGNEPEIIAIPE